MFRDAHQPVETGGSVAALGSRRGGLNPAKWKRGSEGSQIIADKLLYRTRCLMLGHVAADIGLTSGRLTRGKNCKLLDNMPILVGLETPLTNISIEGSL